MTKVRILFNYTKLKRQTIPQVIESTRKVALVINIAMYQNLSCERFTADHIFKTYSEYLNIQGDKKENETDFKVFITLDEIKIILNELKDIVTPLDDTNPQAYVFDMSLLFLPTPLTEEALSKLEIKNSKQT